MRRSGGKQVERRLPEAHYCRLLSVETKTLEKNLKPLRLSCAPARLQDDLGLAAGAAAAAEGEAAEWMGTLESSRYRLRPRTVCTLHSKRPPLPSHLWIINVQSVGLSLAIGRPNTGQFASHTCFSEDTGLVSEAPPLPSPPPRQAQLYESRRDPGQRASATISPQERCYRGTTVSRPLIILTLARHAGRGKKKEGGLGGGLGINICVAFKLQYTPAARRVAFEVFY